ncbi:MULTISPECIES: S1 family peptidase [unclassified Xanthobacter]|uniref:S1 family peptidase n=1 Tax=unclassified Xanthobacter TaxID=2623496 RepID=UPI001EE084B9|nr:MULTISPECIES: trypsin-like serine protease [unclassified Xanthobacter]
MIRARFASAALMAAAVLFGPLPARALVGGTPAGAALARQTVMIVSTRGATCTGTVLAPDLLLTAAHCVAPAGDYAVALVDDGPPKLVPAARIAVHPRFDGDQFRTRRPTPDLALVKLAEPLPGRFAPARLTAAQGLPAKGTLFTLAGFGVTSDSKGEGKGAGTLRSVQLPSIGTTGGIMVRLAPSQGAAGACTGDSGGPAFQDGAVAGVIGWATAAGGARGCGGVTGVTLVSLHRDWITDTAAALGSPLGR